ncbi:PREDICTED: nuclear pore complex protein Nup98-Nup96 isoform X2 [Amphimedon queenslandica]|uniref:Nuclear pore complex protein Nup98-Nup96 n=1 Tax=Amphimedon queenslandica TaxID=400682 RepID=A0AAN0J6L2_AMPQE|nr:PREDICTED: nuclear pore complex protein Nup98-Nup96 isoform X2 [Amphimedon queenslandica]|eukprot:XP_019852669.1 PREDICTED: nuclear pore complex protein Nup98-Nup96 isoform X2 [Amphimedon queenslandica]
MYGTGLSGGIGGGGGLFNQTPGLSGGGGLGAGLGNTGGLGGGIGNMGTGLGGGGMGTGLGGGGLGAGLGGGGLGTGLGGGGMGTGLGGGLGTGLGGGGMGTGLGGNLGAGLGGGGGLFPSSSAAGTNYFSGGGGAGLGGGAGGSGLFNQTPQSHFAGGTGLGGIGSGLGGGTGLGGGGATGLGMGGNLFNSPISSAGGLGGGGLSANRGLFNQSAGGLGGGAGGLGAGAFSTPLFNRTSAATTGTGGLGLGGSGLGMGLGGGGLGMGGMMGGGINNIGTPVAYNPTKGNDVMIKGGQSMNIYTNLNCITGMKQYENKCLEELRFEDYSCNRKGPVGGGGMLVSQAGGGLMGGATSTSAGFFTGGGLGGGFSGGMMGLGGAGQTGMLNMNNMSQNPLQNLSVQQQQAQLQQQIQLLASSPFGDSPLFRTAMSDSEKTKRNKNLTPVSTKLPPSSVSSASPHYKLNVKPAGKFKTISLSTPSSSSSSAQRKDKSAMFEGLNDSIASGESFVPRHSIKKLTFNPKPKETPTHLDSTSLTTPTTASPPTVSTMSATPVTVTKPAFQYTPVTSTGSGKKNDSLSSPEISFALPGSKVLHKPTPKRPLSATPNDTISELGGGGDQSVSSTTPPFTSTPPTTTSSQPLPPPLPPPPPPSGFILTKDGYYSQPSVSEIKRSLQEGKPKVQDLVIGRTNFGKILFTGDTDVSNLNVDELVSINLKEVTVYPDDSLKPPQGEGLNKRAIVSLSGYWPVCKTTRQPIRDPQKLADLGYVNKLRSSTAKIGARFCDYHPDTGTCVFEVQHFSKYKLVADDDDSDDDDDGDQKGGGDKAKKSTTDKTKKAKTLTTTATTTTTTTKTLPTPRVPPPVTKTGQTGLSTPLQPKQPVTLGLSEEEEEEAEPMVGEVSSTMTPSHHLASTLGLDTERLQVMKASFFSDQETVTRTGHTRSSGLTYFDKSPAQFSDRTRQALKPLSAPKSHLIMPVAPPTTTPFSKTPLRFPVETLSSLGPSEQPPPSKKIYLPSDAPPALPHPSSTITRQKIDRLNLLKDSVLSELTGYHRDAGASLGRSFRVGWGPGWTLAHVGQLVSGEAATRPSTHQVSLFSSHVSSSTHSSSGFKYSVVSIEKVDASPWMKESANIEDMYVPLLNVQLSHSCIGGAESMSEEEEAWSHEDVPLIVSVEPQELLKDINATCSIAVEKREPDLFKQVNDVFQLVSALWGQLVEGDEDTTQSLYWIMAERKRRLSKWFQSVLKQKGEDENLFSLLCQFRLIDASRLAHSLNSHRLALIIGQAANPNLSSRLLLQQQLEDWNRIEIDDHIDPSIHCIYVLLSGLLVWEGRQKLVNLCEGLNWRESAALHLWYTLAPTDSVKDFIEKYDASFKGEDPYSTRPTPLYIPPSPAGFSSPHEFLFDTCYHLINLFNRKDYPLDETLAPSGSTPYQLDYRLSWHLWSMLSSLGYNHAPPSFLLSLHTSFSAQLEAVGLWEWAVFVALHVHSPTDRRQLVESILYRHCEFRESEEDTEEDGDLNDKEVFVIEKLLVPQELVYAAKAQSAECEGLYDVQASYLLKAKEWNKAHQIFVSHVIPTAIVSNDIDSILHSLEVLSDHSSSISNWESQGLVYLDYLRVSEKVEELSNADSVSLSQLTEVYALLDCVAGKVDSLSGDTPLECLCQIEISKKMATLIRTVSLLKSELSQSFSAHSLFLFPSLSSLPVPQEHRLFELRQFASSLPLPPTD